ncbi:MAG: hypothetical protein H5T76_03295 [Streptomyces sp.]|nr:hypothetical protein [Streptomyces sp.]
MVRVLGEKTLRVHRDEHVAGLGVRELAEPLRGRVGPQLTALDRVEGSLQ